MRQFLIFFYKNNIPPKEVLINFSLDEKETISSIIEKDRGYKVNIRKPERGKKLLLLKMVKENIKATLKNNVTNDQVVLKKLSVNSNYQTFRTK